MWLKVINLATSRDKHNVKITASKKNYLIQFYLKKKIVLIIFMHLFFPGSYF